MCRQNISGAERIDCRSVNIKQLRLRGDSRGKTPREIFLAFVKFSKVSEVLVDICLYRGKFP